MFIFKKTAYQEYELFSSTASEGTYQGRGLLTMWLKVCPAFSKSNLNQRLPKNDFLVRGEINWVWEAGKCRFFSCRIKTFLVSWMHGWIFKLQVKNGEELGEILILARAPSTWKTGTPNFKLFPTKSGKNSPQQVVWFLLIFLPWAVSTMGLIQLACPRHDKI